MNESRGNSAEHVPLGSSSLVTITVEESGSGQARIILDGFYMTATGFKPGDVVDAIVQPDLISILRAE